MKVTHIFYTLITFLIVVFTSASFADGNYHHKDVTINTYNYVTKKIVSEAIADTFNKADRSEARAAAAGQMHFKSTPNLQWAIGAGFSGGESAFSFGLGYQAGSVFVAANITDSADIMFTKDSDPLITFGTSGEF